MDPTFQLCMLQWDGGDKEPHPSWILGCTLTTLPLTDDCGTQSRGCSCVAPAAQQHSVC